MSRALLSGSHYVLSLCHCDMLLCYEPDVEQIKMMKMMMNVQHSCENVLHILSNDVHLTKCCTCDKRYERLVRYTNRPNTLGLLMLT